MKKIDKVSNLFRDNESIKVVSSVSADGELHSIVAGSVMVVDDDTMAVAEVMMNTTSTNLKANNKVAILGVKGMESYLVTGTVQKRNTDGELYDALAEKFAAMKMQIRGVWTFNIEKIYNESAGPDAGKQIY